MGLDFRLGYLVLFCVATKKFFGCIYWTITLTQNQQSDQTFFSEQAMPPLKVAEFGQNSNKNGQNLTESGKTVVFPYEAG